MRPSGPLSCVVVLLVLLLASLATPAIGQERSFQFWGLGRRRSEQEGQAGGMTRPANERRRFIFGRTRLPEAQPVSAAESAVAGALHLDFSKPKENLTDEQVRDKWIGDVPHEPLPGMMEMLAKAAWKPSPDAPGGLILLTSGNIYAMENLLPRWLDSLSRTRDGDLTRHALVVALGVSAVQFCLKYDYWHHCLLDSRWPGPDVQYHFPDDWYVATTLNKVELIHSVLRLGYSPFWVDTDVVHFGNALPYLHTLDADMAIGCEFCHSWSNLSAGSQGPFEQNTGTFFFRAERGVLDFVRSWMDLQRSHLLEWGPQQFDKDDMFQRRSDQVTLNNFALPQMVAAWKPGQPHIKVVSLTHERFPTWCGGPCGCSGSKRRGSRKFIRLNNEEGHLLTGRIECPAKITDKWFMYHVPCARSAFEKLSIVDAYQHMSDSLHERKVATSHRRD